MKAQPNQITLLLSFFLLGLSSALVIPPQDDDYVIPEPAPLPPTPNCHPDDKTALLVIKEALNNSDVFDSWNPETNCCSGWKFITCNSSTGHVTTLAFTRPVPTSTLNLPATIPTAIGNLSNLNILVFRNNATDPIPSSLEKLKELTYIDLAFIKE